MFKFKTMTATACLMMVMPISADAQSGQIGSTSQPLSHAGNLWSNLTIPVCWETNSNRGPYSDNRARQWTREAIEATWEEVSSINFTNWGNCTSSSQGIRILAADDWPHTKGLGALLNGKDDGMVLNFDFVEWDEAFCRENDVNREYCIRSIAVHEFGHALGFAHEHNRSDRSMCDREVQGTNPTFLITEYDPDSIMNYCSPEWNNGGRISALDVAGARLTYGPFLADTPAEVDVRATIYIVDDETFGSNETGSRDFNTRLSMSTSQPVTEETFSFCVGAEVRVELDIRASLLPGSSEVVMNSNARMYEGTSCGTTELEDTDQTVLQLDPASARGTTRLSLYNDGSGDSSEINITMDRIMGDETRARACTSCEDAASNAVYFTKPKPRPTLTSAQIEAVKNVAVAKDVIAKNPTLQVKPGVLAPAAINKDACKSATQGKVAWDYKGSKSWNQTNLTTLCKGAETSTAPAKCFQSVMHGNLNWGGSTKWQWKNALNLCKGTTNAKTTIDCFKAQTAKNVSWDKAIAKCNS